MLGFPFGKRVSVANTMVMFQSSTMRRAERSPSKAVLPVSAFLIAETALSIAKRSRRKSFSAISVGSGAAASSGASRPLRQICPFVSCNAISFGRIEPSHKKNKSCNLSSCRTLKTGASDGSRTRDLMITSQVLYQLSYAGNISINIHAERKIATASNEKYKMTMIYGSKSSALFTPSRMRTAFFRLAGLSLSSFMP